MESILRANCRKHSGLCITISTEELINEAVTEPWDRGHYGDDGASGMRSDGADTQVIKRAG